MAAVAVGQHRSAPTPSAPSNCAHYPDLAATFAMECMRYQCNCTVGTVTALSLARNNVSGNLEDVLSPPVVLDMWCSLRILFLGNNSECEQTVKITADLGSGGVVACF